MITTANQINQLYVLRVGLRLRRSMLLSGSSFSSRSSFSSGSSFLSGSSVFVFGVFVFDTTFQVHDKLNTFFNNTL